MGSASNTASDRGVFVLQDPEPFYKAQKRNRRATWRMASMCAVAAFLMGVPLNLVLTPVFYAVTLALAEIVNLLFPLPPGFWRQMEALGNLAQKVAEFLDHKGHVDLAPLAWPLTLALVPGMVITLVLWMCVLAVFRHGGVGGTLMSVTARDPKPSDLKELQLANVVHEIAIAAGVPSPKVKLMDSPGANAAVVGTSPADACVVVSRRVLDELNRDQLEGVLGQLIGSIGNGDLRIAFMVTSVFEACGLILALLNAPFSSDTRGLLRRILRYGLRRWSAQAAQAEEADAIGSLLSGYLGMSEADLDRFFSSTEPGRSPWRKLLNFVFFPFILTGIITRFMMFIFLSMLLGPWVALAWRTRRYLADASAVQLTRNPDALATALLRLNATGPTIPNSAWASHLFVMNPRGDLTLASSPEERDRRAAMAWKASEGGDPAAVPPGTVVELSEADMAGYQAEMKRLKQAALRGNFHAIDRLSRFGRVTSRQESDPPPETGWEGASNTSFHPPLKRRLKRLRRMGARLALDEGTKSSFGSRVIGSLALLLILPLALLAAYFLLVLIVLMIVVNAAFMAVWMTVIYTVFSALTHR